MSDFIPFKLFHMNRASSPQPAAETSSDVGKVQPSSQKKVVKFADEYFDENDENQANQVNRSPEPSTAENFVRQVSQSPFHVRLNTPEKDLCEVAALPIGEEDELYWPKNESNEDVALNEVIQKVSHLIQTRICDHPIFQKFEAVQIACQELFGNLKGFNFMDYGLIWCDESPEDIFPISIRDTTIEKHASKYSGYINPFTLSSQDAGLKEAALSYTSEELKKAFTPNDYQRGGSYTLATNLKNLLLLTPGRNVAFCCFRYHGKRYTTFASTASSYKTHSEIKVLGCIPPDLLLKYHYKGFTVCQDCNKQKKVRKRSLSIPEANSLDDQASQDFQTFLDVQDTQVSCTYQDSHDSQDSQDSFSLDSKKRKKGSLESVKKRTKYPEDLSETNTGRTYQPYSPFHPKKENYKRAFYSLIQENLSENTSDTSSIDSSSSDCTDAILKLFTERQPCQKARGHINCEDKLKTLIGFPIDPLEMVTTYYSCSYPKNMDERKQVQEEYQMNQIKHLINPPPGLHKGNFHARVGLSKFLGRGPAVDNTPGKLFADAKPVNDRFITRHHSENWISFKATSLFPSDSDPQLFLKETSQLTSDDSLEDDFSIEGTTDSLLSFESKAH